MILLLPLKNEARGNNCMVLISLVALVTLQLFFIKDIVFGRTLTTGTARNGCVPVGITVKEWVEIDIFGADEDLDVINFRFGRHGGQSRWFGDNGLSEDLKSIDGERQQQQS